MIDLLSAYYGDILVLVVLGFLVGGIVANQFRRKKKGKGCGCGSCQGCSMAGTCQGNCQ